MPSAMSQESSSPQPRSPLFTSSLGDNTSRRESQAAAVPTHDEAGNPVRLPRPMTAAELHHELEKEQEGMVNRLTRELTDLRARASSVASTTSSTSGSSVFDQAVIDASSSALGSTHPTSSRTHRSSSSVSTRSTMGSALSIPGQSQASMDRARDSGSGRSRQNSLVPPNITSVSAPAPPRELPSPRSRPPSVSPAPGAHQQGAFHPPPTPPTPGNQLGRSSSRYDDATAARAALDVARKENELLASRVRELEAALRTQSPQTTTLMERSST